MNRKTSVFIFLSVFFSFALPAVSFAAGLSSVQVRAIVGLLQAFQVDTQTIAKVELALFEVSPTTFLNSATSTTSTAATSIPVVPTNPHVPVVGSLYSTSGLGYDLSYATMNYPSIPFGFAVVGVTDGKSFVHNPRIVSEFSWAHFGSTDKPTPYMNLNAAYGTSASADNERGPKDCNADGASVITTSISAGGTFQEPSLCESYNYGYNAAKDAYAYAQTNKVSSSFWWLDVEEVNSWSENPTVNDATIQGVIDYLNSQNIRAGIYSTPYMWNNIANISFVPRQTVNGKSQSVPNWLPVGIMNQVGATNTCITTGGFISGSPVWIVQYEDSSTSIDRNIAC